MQLQESTPDKSQILEDDDTRLWYKEIAIVYKGTSTGKEYMRYNKEFQRWFDKTKGKEQVTEKAIRDFIHTYI